jgi:prolyl-tRNA synthetase
MAHGDDDGAIIPPRVAPAHVVILPVTPKPENRAPVLEACDQLAAELRRQSFAEGPIRVEVDKREVPGGTKSWDWIKRGAPLRVEIGPRDLEKSGCAVARRDRSPKEKTFPSMQEFVASAAATLQEIQDGLLARAIALRDANTVKIDKWEDFAAYFTPKNPEKPELHGGFALAHWDGTRETEDQIKDELKVTIRCIPLDGADEPGTCIRTGRPSKRRVVFAKAY